MTTYIKQVFDDYNAMLTSGTLPVFEFELNNGEFLVVDIYANEERRFIAFDFDDNGLKTWFDGDVSLKGWGCSGWRIMVSEYDTLQSLLEKIHGNIVEGFLIPNNLYKGENDAI